MRKLEVGALAVLLASVFAIVTELLSPPNVNVVVNSGSQVIVRGIPHVYTLSDILIVIVTTSAAAMSASYVLLPRRLVHSEAGVTAGSEKVASGDKSAAWRANLDGLGNPDEQRLYELVIDQGGTAHQSYLISESGFSKSKVSLLLADMEARGLLEKRRKGMSNVVLLS